MAGRPAGIERLARLIVEAAAPHAAAVKPNLAFFEAYGSAGIAALERVLAARASPACSSWPTPSVATSRRPWPARRLPCTTRLGADAVTVSPYLGLGALEAFLERADRFAYVLCRTSNPGAGELQDLVVAADPALGAPAETLHRRVARRVAAAGLGDRAGLVVGATAPAELARSATLVPSSRSSSPVSARRAATPRRSWPSDRAIAGAAGARRGRRAPGERVAGHRRAAARRRVAIRRIRVSVWRWPPMRGAARLAVLS